MLYLSVEARKIEAIKDVLLVYLAKVFVPLGIQEPVNPILGVVTVGPARQVVHCWERNGGWVL